jgi:hypothetical protein
VKGWQVPRAEVEEKVAWAFDTFDVGRMLCDPPKWWSEIQRWESKYNARSSEKIDYRGRACKSAEDATVVVQFDTNQPRRMSPACGRFASGIDQELLSHPGDPVFTGQVLAMVKDKPRNSAPDDDGRTLYVFTKGPEGAKIDAGIGAVLAWEAAHTMAEGPGSVVVDWAALVARR